MESKLGRFLSVGRDRLAKRKTGGWIDRKGALGVWALARVVPILLVVAIASVTLSAIWIPPASASLSSWSSTTNYPAGIVSQSCVVSSGIVYCIGGGTTPGGVFTPTSAVYFGSPSSSGFGSWSATASYPTTIFRHSCVVNSGFVYCFGGQSPSGVTNAVYFAALSSSGVGSWSTTTNYPMTIYGQSCVVDSGSVYCIGGIALSSTNAVYFAPLSASGLGVWSADTNYPTTIFGLSCVANLGFVYCIGGQVSTSANNATNAVYYAPFVSSGSVGGTLDPIDKLALLAPFIIPAFLIVGATTVGALFVRRAKHNPGNQ